MPYTNEDAKAYWERATHNKKIARNHTDQMSRMFADEIARSAAHSAIFSMPLNANIIAGASGFGTPMDRITVVPKDSVTAIFEESEGKTAVLNFASFKNPGGRFFDGSMAQEEALCHASFLYNVLSQYEKDYYAWNREHKNRALYLNRAIYSEDIRFFRNHETKLCDVITCACPNRTAAQKYRLVSDEENRIALEDRCQFVLKVATEFGVETLILGAFGCGVFGQDAKEVAESFKKALEQYKFQKVVFAIPNTGAGWRNYHPFNELFGR